MHDVTAGVRLDSELKARISESAVGEFSREEPSSKKIQQQRKCRRRCWIDFQTPNKSCGLEISASTYSLDSKTESPAEHNSRVRFVASRRPGF
jgi:hypothetical protein